MITTSLLNWPGRLRPGHFFADLGTSVIADRMTTKHDPQTVLDFWFPDDGHWTGMDRHDAFWMWRMQGGADAAIIANFTGLTTAAARGELDHWAETPRGRLALIIALDQFPRSVWRDTPGAYAQDIKATRLVLEALQNGHYQALPHVWERQFFIIALTHCEGPDHLARMDLAIDLSHAQADLLPDAIIGVAARLVQQAERVRANIAAFGRHPHRNAVLGRISTPAEDAYIAKGDFPHVRKIETPPAGAATG